MLNDTNDSQLINILSKLLTLEVFQLNIKGNDNNEMHWQNRLLISLTFEVFHFDISGNLKINDDNCYNNIDINNSNPSEDYSQNPSNILSIPSNTHFLSETDNYLFYCPLSFTDMSYMFYGCKILISLLDISN